MIQTARLKEVDLKEYWRVLYKRRYVVAALFVAIVTCVTIWVFMQVPIYKASTMVLIDKADAAPSTFREVMGGLDSGYLTYADYYNTQNKIITSRAVLERTAHFLNLEMDPEFAGNPDPAGVLGFMVEVEPIRNTRLLKIHVSHSDPEKTVLYADAMARVFLQYDLERKLSMNEEVIHWLSDQLEDHKRKLEESERNLQRYREEYVVITLPSAQEEGMKLIPEMEMEISRIDTELATLSKRYGPKHPKIIRLTSQLSVLREQLGKEKKRVLELNKKSIQFTVLEREVETNKNLYQIMLRRLKETNLEVSMKGNNLSIIEKAQLPSVPIRPKKKRTVMLAVLLGLFTGIGVAFFLEYLDDTIQTPEDVERLALPLLGTIPTIPSELAKDRGKISFMEPKTSVSEGYRNIRTGVQFATAGKKNPIFLVTSAHVGEGKTLTASNLAITLAQTDHSTLLIDCDLRKPSMHQTFGLRKSIGLTNYLVGKASWEEVACDVKIPNLTVIPSGVIPPNPSELLSSEAMKAFLENARERFDFVILDSPPLLPVTDSALLSSVVTGVVLVIRSGITGLREIEKVQETLKQSKSQLIGIVLNDLNLRRTGYGYSYYYYYSYEYRYGKKEPEPETT